MQRPWRKDSYFINSRAPPARFQFLPPDASSTVCKKAVMSRAISTVATPTTSSKPRTTDDHGGTPPIGPLTTIYTPPATCISTDYYSQKPPCGPSASLINSLILHDTSFDTAQIYFSPAICPSGYTLAGSWNTIQAYSTEGSTSFDTADPFLNDGSIIGTKTDIFGGPTPEVGETASFCCPRSVPPASHGKMSTYIRPVLT
jgi:hypothetical protein